MNLLSSSFPYVSFPRFILRLISSRTSSAFLCAFFTVEHFCTASAPHQHHHHHQPPHCCIIQWLVLSPSTSPLFASRSTLLPCSTKGWTTHTRGMDTLCPMHLAVKCFPASADKWQAVLKSTMSPMLLLSLSLSLSLPQIPAWGWWGEVVGGPQRSLKQQLQADAGTDYNRTRRLLFITGSST